MFKKMVSLAMALASRGLTNNKIDIVTKKIRTVSCFGHGDISPCHNLRKSNNSEYFYCGGCGCGDNSNTWLIKNEGEYAKLDYPSLNCPLQLPGFSNYDPNSNLFPERKEQIENFDPELLDLIQVTIGRSEEKENLIAEVNKIIENS